MKTTMTLRDLAEMVAKMRHAQVSYFRTRTPAALEESKRLERQVDAACREALRQPGLFDEESR